MDGMHFVLGVAGFLLLLAGMAWAGDSLDRRDSERRNGR